MSIAVDCTRVHHIKLDPECINRTVIDPNTCLQKQDGTIGDATVLQASSLVMVEVPIYYDGTFPW